MSLHLFSVQRAPSPDAERSGAMALFVFLPAAAPARLVAADLGFVASHGLDRRVVASRSSRAGWPGWRCTSSPRPSSRQSGAHCRRRGTPGRRPGHRRTRRATLTFDNWAPTPEVTHHLFIDARLHCLEQIDALALVLDERIGLPVATQSNTFLEMVEAVQMVFPLRVDNLQHDVALDAPQNCRIREDLLLGLVLLDRQSVERVNHLIG